MKNMVFKNYEEFLSCTVARADNVREYEADGIIAVVKDNVAGIARYSHCSCYGTAEALDTQRRASEQIVPDFDRRRYTRVYWTGTPDEMVTLAEERKCFDMEGRVITSKDCDYEILIELYDKIIVWDKNGRQIVVERKLK